MNRRRSGGPKQFVSGGVYNAEKPGTPTSYEQKLEMMPEVIPEPPKPPPVIEQIITDEKETLVDENGKLKFKKIFMTRKKSSVRMKEKKIRQNRQLRKALLPKNALMALNEVKGISISDFTIDNKVGGGFTALVTVNAKQYEGSGTTKVAAKNSACEKALRDYVITKMLQKPRVVRNQPGSMEAVNTAEAEDAEMSNSETANSDDADDVPMVNLASFAIFKLFTEWESEGFVIPELHPATIPPKNALDPDSVAAPKEPKRTELPPNWEAMHPATLLCLMRPGLSYTNYEPIGEKPNILQCVGVTVDTQEFMGKGRSKKLARRNAAVDVCNTLFSTNFTKEEEGMDLAE